MIAASRMKLETQEVQIDPLLMGIARVTKRIGDREYRAWVEARGIQTQGEITHLSCFPDHLPRRENQPDSVRIMVNEWTTWKVPQEDFNLIEWIDNRTLTQTQEAMPADESIKEIIQQAMKANQEQDTTQTPPRPRE